MKKNIIKVLDNVNIGILTINKIIHANNNFSGVNFNSYIVEKKSNVIVGI